VCVDGYAGRDCSQRLSAMSAVWSVLPGPRDRPLTRIGHSLVSCASDTHLLYMFGGYSLQRGVLNDLWRYNVTGAQWQLMQTADTDQPAPRFALPPHCDCVYSVDSQLCRRSSDVSLQALKLQLRQCLKQSYTFCVHILGTCSISSAQQLR